MSKHVAELALTGERTLPGIPAENYWFRRHEAAYAAALPFVLGARVLDAGCGEGYGAALLSSDANHVTAIDYDAATVAHLARTYHQVRVVRGNLVALPLRAGAFEAVATLQVVEHLYDQQQFVAECARVLRPAGTLIVSTPNRLTFSLGQARPLNPFHTREFAAAELEALLSPHFDVRRVWGVHHGRRLQRWARQHGDLISAQLSQPPDDWPPKLRRLIERVHARDFVVHGENIDTSLDLFFVAVKRG